MSAEDGASAEGLRDQLRLALASAQAAYQDSTRLIRLLTILGRPGAPDELVEETLTTLSEVFQADVTAVARLVDDRLMVTASCGLPEGHPAFVTGWIPSPTATGVLRDGLAVTGALTAALAGADSGADSGVDSGVDSGADAGADSGADSGADAGAHSGPEPAGSEEEVVRRLGLRSAAWLPLPEDRDRIRHLLILYRSRPEPFTSAEMALLGSVAGRLLLSVEARHRAVALERLARTSHVLPQHRRLVPLLDDAGRLLRDLVGGTGSAVVAIRAGRASRVDTGTPGGAARAWLPGPDDAEASDLPGWRDVGDGRPRLVDLDGPGGARPVLVVPAGPQGAPEALLYAGWTDLPPLMSPVTETAAIFASHLSAALLNVSLYRALSHSEASLRLITDSIGDLIAVIGPAHQIVYASASYERGVAHAPEHLVGRSVVDLVRPDDRAAFQDALHACLSASAPASVEYRLCTGDGRSVWAESVIRPADAPDGNLVMSTRLIEDRKRREEEWRRLAVHDPLTGLANRAYAVERLDQALGADSPGDVGLLFCDLDRFKHVNDELGHAAGDDLLQQVARRLRGSTRARDLIARLGGDEFVFVLDGVTSLDEVAEVGQRVARSFAEPFALAGELVEVSVSVGASVGARGQASVAGMLESADSAMYEAKRRGTGLHRTAIRRVLH